ncbi:colanic acid biosynthesis glycosyltransferase WcaL [Polaribacter aestuariivivens]|uniref:Colanic acid biosynthesis glycosyltransferase WcaL n=1 Tax=Polaribacter aestuariivivens TaxID=2304626 RepID=A0A5S3N7R3_9FLAO|nr:glycosyltransferase [Polaribacter aestuariivivens]TMM31353.1 colanic acid biosynthesis glycosyltransferase WcaL [Polaribacter aestuariivivens]
MNKILNVALISPSKNAYSETFIQMHRKGIEGNVVYYFNGDLPTKNNLENRLASNIYKLFFRIKKIFKFTQLTILEQSLKHSFKKHKIDIVVAEYGTTAAAVYNVCFNTKIPLLPIFHGFDASINHILETHKNKYEKIFNYSKYIVVVSNKIAETLITIGCLKNKIIITPCAPQNKFFDIKPNFKKNNFLAVGRFVDKKAPYYTILSFVKVLRKYPNAKLQLIGDGPLKNVCENLINYYKVSNNIKIIGAVKSKDIDSYFENSYSFLQHSVVANNGDSEGTPVSVLEASAAGLPVVSTKHGGISDVILNNKTGFLVDEHNVELMAEKICNLIEDKLLAKKMGQEGRAFVRKNFSYQNHISTINKAIKNSL